MSSDDPTYPKFHYECNEAILKRFEALGVISYLVIQGTEIMYSLNDSFQKALDKELDDTHYHIVTDQAVDDDIVTMLGVIRAVANYLPKETPKKDVHFCIEFVFNALMMQKYGRPVPMDKRFHSRAKEFAKEVYTFDTDEATANYLKTLKRMRLGF